MKTEKNNALINALTALSNSQNLVGGSRNFVGGSRVNFDNGPKAIPYYGGEIVKGPSYNGQVKRGARWVAAEEVLPDAIPYFRKVKPNFSSIDEAEAGLTPSIKSTIRANKVNQNWQRNLDKVFWKNLHHLANLSSMSNPGAFAIAKNDPSLMGDQKILTDGFTVPISENYTNYYDPEHGWQVLDTIEDANGVLWYTDVNGDRKVLDAGLPDTYSFKEFPDVGYHRPDYTKPVRDLNPLDIADFNTSYSEDSELYLGLPKYKRDLKSIAQSFNNVYPGFPLEPYKLYGTTGNLESIAEHVLNSSPADDSEDVGIKYISNGDTESIPDTTVTSGVVVGPETNNVPVNATPTVNSVAKSIVSKKSTVSKQKPVLKAAPKSIPPKSTPKVATTVNSAPVVAAPTNTITVQPTAQVATPSLDSIMQHKKQAYANYQNQVRQSAIDAFNRSGYGNPLDALRNGAISEGQFKIIANGY